MLRSLFQLRVCNLSKLDNQKRAKFVEISAPREIFDFVYTTGEPYGPPKEQSLIIDSKKD